MRVASPLPVDDEQSFEARSRKRVRILPVTSTWLFEQSVLPTVKSSCRRMQLPARYSSVRFKKR